MAKNELKTKETGQSVFEFLNKIENKQRREDGLLLLKWMKEISQLEPKMWGPSIVGFGTYHYKYESGREGDMLKIGFSPRKNALTLYLTNINKWPELSEKLGKYKTSVSCLYIHKLKDIDEEILKKLISKSFEYMNLKYG